MGEDEKRPKWGPGPNDEGKRDLSFGEKILGDVNNMSPFNQKIVGYFNNVFVKPAQAIRSVVEGFRGPETENWYHRKYRRVPTIDECYFHDWACRYKSEFYT